MLLDEENTIDKINIKHAFLSKCDIKVKFRILKTYKNIYFMTFIIIVIA